VPADLIALQSKKLKIDTSLLTGESGPVTIGDARDKSNEVSGGQTFKKVPYANRICS
jgi:magnesium-transporting ATPase (P-type)